MQFIKSKPKDINLRFFSSPKHNFYAVAKKKNAVTENFIVLVKNIIGVML